MKKWWWWRAGQSLRIGTAFGIFRNAHGGASPPTPAQSARQRQSPVLPLPGACGGRRGRPTKARPSPLTLDGATLKRGGLRAHGERKLFFLFRAARTRPPPTPCTCAHHLPSSHPHARHSQHPRTGWPHPRTPRGQSQTRTRPSPRRTRPPALRRARRPRRPVRARRRPGRAPPGRSLPGR
jgi:hypothetical protein